MDPRHSRGPLGPCHAFVVLSFTATLSCSPPVRWADEAADPQLDLTSSQLSGPELASPELASAASPKLTLFESGQVRPLAMSPDRRFLFAVNTTDDRLEVFRMGTSQLVRTASIPVGLELLAVTPDGSRVYAAGSHPAAHRSRAPSDEGADDHAKLARHGQPRPHALAR